VRQAVARTPKNPQFHQILGELLLTQKQPQAAIAALEEGLALNPSQTALRLLVFAYQQLPDQEAVAKRIEERVTDPKTPPFYFLILAMLYEQQQKFDKALNVYNALLARNLFPVIAHNNLSYLLADHFPTPENLDRALRLASETLEEFPDDPNLLDTVGWILCKQGNFAKGKIYLEQSVAQFPNHPTSLYHLGWCRAKLGETEMARESLKKALDLKTGFPERAATEQLLASLSSEKKP
jgi:tetratricopeptide (TPR) repeat protein